MGVGVEMSVVPVIIRALWHMTLKLEKGAPTDPRNIWDLRDRDSTFPLTMG